MSKPKNPKAITEQTRRQILEAAWDLIAGKGRADVGLSEIAAQAGVSRQTVFYAFGNRSGVLTAMVRHQDTLTDHVERIRAAVFVDEPTPDSIIAAAEAWLDYLPVVYPVGILLDAASLTDAAAADAWSDRMIGALLGGFRNLVAHVHASTALDGDPGRLAEEVWAHVHPTMWRRLVVECGWTPSEFRESRLRVIRSLVGRSKGRPRASKRKS
jgi:AcrR family transcriptional regulator